ncbi:MAG TPA: NeuD/PglB/VioB family sugar acetyltransferase [Longimicrobiaceae bacterium]|nr:NeuD/PglB/VioB family sugar acetyltransferase [Longimicrobiaceae bacterium]
MTYADGVVVIGAGGHGKSVVSVLLASGMPVAGVLDDDPAAWGRSVVGVPVLGPLSELGRMAPARAVIGLGENDARRAVAERFPEVEWVRVVYPGAYVNPTARIGAGTVVFPGTLIGADVAIGAHVVVSGHATVGHDVVLEDFVHVAPGVQIAGSVHVEAGAMLAIGSIVCPGVRIGAGAMLGAGAVAVHDVPAGCTALGIPARPRG